MSAAPGAPAPRTPRPELSDEELARITQALFDVLPDAGLFDNVPSDWTWGELVQAVANHLAAAPVSRGAPTPAMIEAARRVVIPWGQSTLVLPDEALREIVRAALTAQEPEA